MNCPKCGNKIITTAGRKVESTKGLVELKTGFCFRCEHYVEIENGAVAGFYQIREGRKVDG